jgi:para-nitrobenzyl esterase
MSPTSKAAETTKEDCLFVNVWTPGWPTTLRLPVMVWIHGGGNLMGRSARKTEDGEQLARRGVVVVSFDCRLGPFGFFAHPALTRESPHHASGNQGILDQIAALKWVRDNITKLGGDPRNVTIFGETALCRFVPDWDTGTNGSEEKGRPEERPLALQM